jgi:methionine-rich copper-binding protein CopC
MRRAFAAACLAALLGLASTASAHAILVGSQPKEATEVVGPDVDVSLEFNSRIDAARSSLQLAREDAVSAVSLADGSRDSRMNTVNAPRTAFRAPGIGSDQQARSPFDRVVFRNSCQSGSAARSETITCCLLQAAAPHEPARGPTGTRAIALRSSGGRPGAAANAR